jgi:hypothetical protein
MLNFPVRYTFNAVGRTGGDEGLRDVYVEEVKKIIIATSGDEDESAKLLHEERIL